MLSEWSELLIITVAGENSRVNSDQQSGHPTPSLGSPTLTTFDPYTIRLAVSADLPDILVLEAECFSGDRLSRRALAHHVSSPTALLLVAESHEASCLAAYSLSLSHAGRRADRLYSLAVARDHRGQGLATRLLQAAERRSSAPSLYLEVRADNDPAIALYERLGFTTAARRAAYYQDGMDAFLMTKSIPA